VRSVGVGKAAFPEQIYGLNYLEEERDER